MSLEVVVRPTGDRARDERCPYCHDVLDEARASDEEVRCDGCGTTHHLACIVELGRCTVIGCERPLAASGLAADALARGSARSRVLREVQRRIRRRARTFVQANCRAPTSTPAQLPGLLAVTLEHAERARRDGEWEAAAHLWGEVARIATLSRPDDLAGAPHRVDPEYARELAETMEAYARDAQRLRLIGWAVVCVVLPLLLGLIAAL